MKRAMPDYTYIVSTDPVKGESFTTLCLTSNFQDAEPTCTTIDLSQYVQGEITDVSSNPFDEDTLWVETAMGRWLLKISDLK